jgi:hypothetical protein
MLSAGCADDPCRTLCTEVAEAIDECRPEWGVTWEELGATRKAGWRNACQTAWDTSRAELEAREVTASEDQCTDGSEELADLDCDALRALYLP